MHKPQTKSQTSLWLCSVPIIVGALAALWHYSLAGMDQLRIVVMTLLLGWLAYRYLLPLQMIKRHALLNHITTDSSIVRHLFWNGGLIKLILAASSVFTALFVLVMITGLQLFEWYVLLGSIPSFLLLYFLSDAVFGTHFNAEHRFHFTLRIAHRLNLVAMTAVLVTVQILWLEVSDTRYLSISEVFQSAYAQHSASAALDEVGWLIGINSAITDSLWHIMQLTARADTSTLTKLLAWLAFLVFSAIKLGAVWTILLGIPVLLNGFLGNDEEPNRQSRRRKTVGGMIAAGLTLGAGAYLFSTQISIAPLWNAIPERLQHTLGIDPCRKQASFEQEELAAQANQVLTNQQKQLMARMDREIDRHIDRAFMSAESGIDSFLDWNFSLKGQYTQLLFLSRSMVGESTFAEHIGQRMDGYIDNALGPGMNRLNDRLDFAFNDGMQKVYQTQSDYLDGLVRQADCITLTKPDLPLTDYVNKSLVGTGLLAGPTAGVLAVRAGARAVRPAARLTAGTGSRVATKPASKRIISRMFARLTTRAAAGTASGSVGAVCGPFALACGSAFALATWIGMDIAINEVDEAINRERMREDMLEALNEQKVSVKAKLKQQYHHAASLAFGAVERYQNQTFNIRRDAFEAEPRPLGLHKQPETFQEYSAHSPRDHFLAHLRTH